MYGSYKKRNHSITGNQNGMSILQVMIAAAIGAIVLMAFASVLTSGNIEAKALTEKMALMDFEQSLIRAMADSTTCTTLLTNPAPVTFDSTSLNDPNSTPLNKMLPNTKILSGSQPSSAPIAIAGTVASALVPTLVISPAPNAFQLSNIQGNGNTYVANFQVNFDQLKLVRALHPATVKITLKTTNVGSLQTVVSCVGATMNAQDVCTQWGGRFYTGPTTADNRCILKQQIISDDPNENSSRAAFEVNSSTPIAPNGIIGHVGLGLPYGEFYADGGDDSVVSITNSGASISGFTTISYNPGGVGGSPGTNAANNLIVMNDGRVGIGYPDTNVPSSPTAKLYVQGDISLNGSVLTSSDRRLKENIQPIADAMEKLEQIAGVTYVWKDIKDKNAPQHHGPDIGVIAQDVEKIFPEMVMTDSHDYKSVAYQKLIPVLIEGSKELHQSLLEKDQQIEALRRELQQIKALICADHSKAAACK